MILKSASAPFRFIGAGLKAFSMRFGSVIGSMWLLPRTVFNYAADIGDGTGSNIVVACVNWMCRTFPEAPLMQIEITEDGTRKPVIGASLPRLLERPNPFYSGPLLWTATIADLETSGNGYWIKIRDQLGSVVQLWWAPAATMEPRWPESGNVFISHYDYTYESGKKALEIRAEDVVHFRYGLDTNNPRKGISPLKTLFREIWTDDEAANFTAALMKNLGVPGVVLSPKQMPTGGRMPSEQDLEESKETFRRKFGGDRRGEPLMFPTPTDVSVLSFSPEQMDLRGLRRIPEERVSAVIGIPAIVVGLGAGLDRSTFSNMAEARESAYEGKVIPTQRLLAADIRHQLLPDFDENPSMDVEFDISRVRVLQPDMDKLFERLNRGVLGGWVMVGEAKRTVGLPASEQDNIYLRPVNMIPVPGDEAGDPNFSPLKEIRDHINLERMVIPSSNGHREEVAV